MKYYDISTPIGPKTVSWDNEWTPVIKWEASMASGCRYNLSSLKINTHTGTHLDAPFHFIQDGKKIDEIDLSLFMGEAQVITIREKAITADVLENSAISNCQKILFKTGAAALYDRKEFSRDFPALEDSGAQWLVDHQITLVGIEYLSIERYGNHTHSVHRILLENNIIILEGLNLSKIISGKYQLIALPIKLEGTEGAPTRAILLPL